MGLLGDFSVAAMKKGRTTGVVLLGVLDGTSGYDTPS